MENCFNSNEKQIWQDVLHHLELNPWLVACPNMDNTDHLYLLHKIIAALAPLDVVQRVLAAFPAAVCKVDAQGNLPLHKAPTTGSSSVVVLLVEAFESGSSVRNLQGQLPLNWTT